MTTAKLEEQLKKLTPAEKKQLLRHLIADLDESQDRNAKQAWLEEAQRRYTELKDGSVAAVPADIAIAKARDRPRNARCV